MSYCWEALEVRTGVAHGEAGADDENTSSKISPVDRRVRGRGAFLSDGYRIAWGIGMRGVTPRACPRVRFPPRLVPAGRGYRRPAGRTG